MFFDKTRAVSKEIKRRENANKEHIKAQQKSLKDLLPFQARIAQTLKILNMILDELPEVESVSVITDPSSETLVNEFMYTSELKDYVVKKDTNNSLLYDIKYNLLDI